MTSVDLWNEYSPLHTIMTKSFFVKKFEFRETGRKHPYTLFVIDSSFCACEFCLPSHKKSPLSFVQKPLHRTKTAQNAERKICWRNNGKNALHTICVLQLFHYFVNFSLLFAISVQRAYNEWSNARVISLIYQHGAVRYFTVSILVR